MQLMAKIFPECSSTENDEILSECILYERTANGED